MGCDSHKKARRRTAIRPGRKSSRPRARTSQRVAVVTLGCVRNLVDSQQIIGRIQCGGNKIVDVRHAETVILNTCAFTLDAKQESIDAILDLIALKKRGRIKRIVLAGCLAQRYGADLIPGFPEIDAVVGVPKFPLDPLQKQPRLTPPHLAYVKICESCYNLCRFCVIPKIKGKFSSRTIESIISEVRRLDREGVKEIVLIGQDITAYGIDLYRRLSLARLLKEMAAEIRNVSRIRLLYTYPAHITDELIELIARERKICRYIDVPLQHISSRILKAMGRRMTSVAIRQLIGKIRRRIPGVCLRTTFIVGLPGETERDFQQLLAFVRTTRFEKVGVFAYSQEEGTLAYDMAGQVPEDEKQRRRDILMREQRRISRERHEGFVGKVLDVLIDERPRGQDNVYVGRTEYDAPEVDGVVYVRSRKRLRPGDVVPVKIDGAMEYDLTGEYS